MATVTGPRCTHSCRTGRWLAGVIASVAIALPASCGGQSASDRANRWLTAGLQSQAAGQTATARRDYDQVLALDPRNKFALYDLGLLDELAGNIASAETRYRAALAVDPNFTKALYNLAILQTPDAPSEAVTLYREVITLDPNNSDAHYNLGLLLVSLGQGPAGNAEIARALSLNPSLAKPAAPPTTTASPTTTTTKTSPTSH